MGNGANGANSNPFQRAALFGKFARDSSRLTRYRKCIDPISCLPFCS